MKNILMVALLFLAACATKPKTADLDFDDAPESKAASSAKKETKPKSIVVDTKDLQTLEKMNKAIEDYVLRKQTKSFTSLCKDKRFDCFVGEKLFPHGKKKISRTVPPYASGSKMGLQGEERVHVKYDFYP